MTQEEKGQLYNLLTIYFDDLESDIEDAESTGDPTSELDDLLTSVDDIRSSLK